MLHGTANAATVSVTSNFNDVNLGCFNFSCCASGAGNCSPDFVFSFTDPVPVGAVVTRVRIVSESFIGSGAPAERAELNGTLINTATPGGSCDCATVPICTAHNVESSQYASGFPGYQYGTTNRLQITVTNAGTDTLCTDRITVEIEYSLCGNQNPELGEDCDDGDADYCNGCTPACTFSPTCSDGNVCTDDVCDPATGGCTNPNNTASCNDGNACTTGDTCSGGSCGGTALNCNDGNPCTNDSCNPSTGACINSTVNCTDGDLCTTDSCNPANGVCQNVPISCDDQNVCTTDMCSAGVCSNATIAGCCILDNECDDGDPCTTDQCIGNVCVSSGTCVDAGVSMDAAPVDTGPPDTGVIDMGVPDLGPADLGFADTGMADTGGGVGVPDASTDTDGAVTPDAAAPADVGFVDSGVVVDSGGIVMDATVMDALAAEDAGFPPEADAGEEPADAALMGADHEESGTRLNDGQGCSGCTLAQGGRGPSSPAWALFAALLLLRRRRSSVV